MRIVHLTASTFLGGPERQMLGLSEALPSDYESRFISFSEEGRCRSFVNAAKQRGFQALELENDSPRIRSTLLELTDRLRDSQAEILISHGYKSNVLGRLAARKLRIPSMAVSRGWTGESWKVHLYETLDRYHLRFMDRVVCVSEGQAKKVRRTGVSRRKIRVIPNASRLNAFESPDPQQRQRLLELFPRFEPGDLIIMAAGRLSPEKGFDLLIAAAEEVIRKYPKVRFILFGEGTEQSRLQNLIGEFHLEEHFVLGGFRNDLDAFFPWADLMVSSSHTEGLPNVLLEAAAASRPIVATAVGGTPEVVIDGVNGFLVEAGNSSALAQGILTLCEDVQLRLRFGQAGRLLMESKFSFQAQSEAYQKLFQELRSRIHQGTFLRC